MVMPFVPPPAVAAVGHDDLLACATSFGLLFSMVMTVGPAAAGCWQLHTIEGPLNGEKREGEEGTGHNRFTVNWLVEGGLRAGRGEGNGYSE